MNVQLRQFPAGSQFEEMLVQLRCLVRRAEYLQNVVVSGSRQCLPDKSATSGQLVGHYTHSFFYEEIMKTTNSHGDV